MAQPIRILGIDPGSRITGFGVIESDGRRSVYRDSGCIRTPDGEFADRLRRIFIGVREVCAAQRPDVVAVERVFMARNADSAIKLGQARSAAICGTFEFTCDLHEYAARAVKSAVVGTGAAEKAQVARMVAVLLNLPRERVFDADEADALAVALCHAHTAPLTGQVSRLMPAAGTRR